MPYYKGVLDQLIKGGHKEDAQAVAERLLMLRNRLKKQVPQRNALSSLLLATWNIRELGADEKFGTRLDESLLYADEPEENLLALNEALDKLAREDPQKAELVKLRFFAGLSVQEAADALGVSRATADRYWGYAKVWLYCEISGQGKPS